MQKVLDINTGEPISSCCISEDLSNEFPGNVLKANNIILKGSQDQEFSLKGEQPITMSISTFSKSTRIRV